METPQENQLRLLAEGYTAAWCSQEPASVAAFYSHDGSLQVNAGTPAVGRKAIEGIAQGFMTAFPDMKVIMNNLVVEGSRVIYHWTLVGTNTGPGGTGKRIRISGFEQWRIGADGLIAESQGQFDAREYERQIQLGFTEP